MRPCFQPYKAIIRQKIRLLASRSAVWKSSRIFDRLTSHSYAASAVLCLDPSHQCCLPDLPDVSSRTSILFLVTPVNIFLVCFFRRPCSTTVLHDCVPCAMPLLHRGRPYASDGQSLPRSTISWGLNIPEEVPFSPCHFYTAAHLLAGGGRLPPGSTISPGPFLPLLAALVGQIADPTAFP
jgi:hypothetical protein